MSWRLSNDPIPDDANDEEIQPEYREKTRCKRFLGYTSNLVSSGLRENFRYLAQHRLVDVIVTTAGGIEEDFVKCLCPTYVLGGFRVDGTSLRRRGLNRIGNLVVPNDNYCRFEEWLMPILDQMLKEQKEQVRLSTLLQTVPFLLPLRYHTESMIIIIPTITKMIILIIIMIVHIPYKQ